jgi:hypothetical protein
MNDSTVEKPSVSVEPKFIQDLITQQKLVSLYLTNGIRLQVHIPLKMAGCSSRKLQVIPV